MATSPEGVRLQWDATKEEISKRADELIEQSRKVFDAVGALKPDDLSFKNCLKVNRGPKLFFVSDKVFTVKLSSKRKICTR